MTDLVALVADKNFEFALRGLFTRHMSLGTRPIAVDIFVHPEKDPGCFLHGHDFLRSFQRAYSYALVLFDREGCGREQDRRTDLERRLEERLSQSGWTNRAGVVVVDPELESWVWADSPHVERVLGWTGRTPDLRAWLAQNGFATLEGHAKPVRPKEAVEQALQTARKPRSSALYRELAQTVTLGGCTDVAFLRLCELLRSWFPADAPQAPVSGL